jgi:hypothetical protein
MVEVVWKLSTSAETDELRSTSGDGVSLVAEGVEKVDCAERAPKEGTDEAVEETKGVESS